MLVALYPLFVLYGGYFSSETLSLALLLASLWLLYAARSEHGSTAVLAAAAAGVCCAILIAARPQFLLNLAIPGVPLLWHWRRAWRPAAALAVSALAVSALAVSAGSVAYNSAGAGHLTGIGQAGGITFYQAQCEVRSVTAGSAAQGGMLVSANPVEVQLRRGREVSFPKHPAWDQSFFYGKGMRCVRDSGLGHLARLGRNLLDATATSTPWPLPQDGTSGAITQATNVGYSLLLPLILVGALLLGRREGWPAGPRDLLLHLACAVPVVLIFSSEPRHRVPYDVFGLALLVALVMELQARRRGQTRRSLSTARLTGAR